MRVDFRSAEVPVSQELLHVPDTGAATQEMRRAAMTEGVDCGFEFNLESIVADALGDHLVQETTAGK